ncbi:MAG: hypothetical protein H0W06_09385 [Chloroflexia bacterium]|nr:hypothetical protein [Chloroflexia bacterium]
MIFRCLDHWGRAVILTERRWAEHVLSRRPYFAGHEEDVRDTITDPAFVVYDIDYPSRENYYRPSPLPYPYAGVLIKVVVDFRGRESSLSPGGTMVTVYLTSGKKPGEEQRWP